MATDPDTKLPRINRVKFAYNYVLNGKEDDEFTWITLKEIYGKKNEEQFVGCLYELMLMYMKNATNIYETPVMQGDDLLKSPPKKHS